jgi:hypothetical protein
LAWLHQLLLMVKLVTHCLRAQRQHCVSVLVSCAPDTSRSEAAGGRPRSGHVFHTLSAYDDAQGNVVLEAGVVPSKLVFDASRAPSWVTTLHSAYVLLSVLAERRCG